MQRWFKLPSGGYASHDGDELPDYLKAEGVVEVAQPEPVEPQPRVTEADISLRLDGIEAMLEEKNLVTGVELEAKRDELKVRRP